MLPPANDVWNKVIFSEASVILFTGGCVCLRGGVSAYGGSASRGGGWPDLPDLPMGKGWVDPIPNQKSGRYVYYLNGFLFSMRIISLASCRVVADDWCKRAVKQLFA